MNAFEGCTRLQSLNIPDNLTSIGNDVFLDCYGLTTITVGENNSVYDSRDNCNALILTQTNTLLIGSKNTTIPSTVHAIGADAFEKVAISAITIPTGVREIGDNAFANCKQAKSISIPDTVSSITDSYSAFRGCSNVTSIVVDANNAYFDSRSNCNAIIKKSNNTLVHGCTTSVIPNTVVKIEPYAFQYIAISAITIPSSVSVIGNNAFHGSSLTTIEIPNTVTSLGYSSFTACKSLSSMTISEGITSLPMGLCDACDSLTQITIPSTLQSIGNTAFAGTAITEFTFPSGMTSFGTDTFLDCKSLSSVTFSEGITSVPANIFGTQTYKYCDGMRKVVIPSTVSTIDSSAFVKCRYLEEIYIPNGSTISGFPWGAPDTVDLRNY